MKKTFHTFLFSVLVLVYITTNVGVFVYYHYCGGELENVSALVKVKSCCSGMDEREGSDCCRNEARHISLKLEFSPAKSSQPDFVPPLTPLYFLLPQQGSAMKELWPAFSSSPYFLQHPPDPVALLIVRSSVFRI